MCSQPSIQNPSQDTQVTENTMQQSGQSQQTPWISQRARATRARHARGEYTGVPTSMTGVIQF
jgi:hypothetical protein